MENRKQQSNKDSGGSGRTLATLEPVIEEIGIKAPGVHQLEDGWNADHHIELSLRVSECQALVRLFRKLKKRGIKRGY